MAVPRLRPLLRRRVSTSAASTCVLTSHFFNRRTLLAQADAERTPRAGFGSFESADCGDIKYSASDSGRHRTIRSNTAGTERAYRGGIEGRRLRARLVRINDMKRIHRADRQLRIVFIG